MLENFHVRNSKKSEQTADLINQNMERRIAAMPDGICPVDIAKCFVSLCHAQSCGKCTPCRIGLSQVENILEKILDNRADESDLKLLEALLASIRVSSDCVIGSNAAEIVLNNLNAFRDEYLLHVREHRCGANHSSSISCTRGCPAGVDIPAYISCIENGDPDAAVEVILKDNPLPVSCAYICTHPCEKNCRRSFLDSPVNIRGLKKYAVENAKPSGLPRKAEKSGKKVAVIGGGPAGLTAAYYLSLMGHDVTVFERQKKLGGMLRYGIPSYRFPREKLDEEIKYILSAGMDVKLNTDIGTDITLEEIDASFDAVFIGIGAQSDKKARIENETAVNVFPAVKILHDVSDGNAPELKNKTVLIVGGGNVAMDATRTAVRLGAKKVTCVYRRRIQDMTADKVEIEGAMAEGAEILSLKAPVRVETDADGKAVGLLVKPQIIGEIDASGRPKPVFSSKEEEFIPADVIIMAIGQAVETGVFENFGLPVNRGSIVAETDGSIASRKKFFSGGECVTGPDMAIRAIAYGKAAARSIDTFLGFRHEIPFELHIPERKYQDKKARGRVEIAEREAGDRKNDFVCIEGCMTKEEAETECGRCLHCDLFGCGNFQGGRIEKW